MFLWAYGAKTHKEAENCLAMKSKTVQVNARYPPINSLFSTFNLGAYNPILLFLSPLKNSSRMNILQDLGWFIFILLLFTAEWERLLNKLPTHWTLLKILNAAIAQARVPAGQEYPVHCAILAHNAVFTVFFMQFWFIFSQSSLFQQASICASLIWRGTTRRWCRTICRHEELLKYTYTQTFSTSQQTTPSTWTHMFHVNFHQDRFVWSHWVK